MSGCFSLSIHPLYMAISNTISISSSYSSSSPPFFSTILSSSLPLSSSSSSKFIATNNLICNEALSITAGKEAVELASAAVEAAREAVKMHSERDGNGDLVLGRRKKRIRKRRKGSVDNYSPIKDAQFRTALLNPVNAAAYLPTLEEAQFSQCLKDQTRLEVTRRKIAEIQEHEPTLQQVAKAMRMNNSSIDKITHKGRLSRAIIIHNYHRLVASIANTYKGKGLSIQDLIQEGSIGLLRGAERFDPTRGNKLSTYVYWWIKEAIITSISNKSRLLRLPGSMQDKITKIAKARAVLHKRLGRLPSYDEIAEMLNVHVSTVCLGYQMSRSPLSLDRAFRDESSMTIQEIIPGPDEFLPDKMWKKEVMKEEVEKLLETVSEREAGILRLRFGLNGETPQSYEEIGRCMKLTRERIRQINKLALANLRHRSIMDDLKLYIL